MCRMWTLLSTGAVLLLCAASAKAEPIVFSSGGSMGYYYDAFLVSTEQVGSEESHRAVVRIVSNDGTVSEGEWSVNCSRGLPRVTRPDGSSILIDLAEGPPSATFTDHELWWAVCTGAARRLSSDHADPPAGVEPNGSSSFRALGSTFRFKVLPADKAAVMPSLATVRISGAGKSEFNGQEAVVFCSTEPTVFWKRSDLMVQLGWIEPRDQNERDTREVSAALHQAICGSPGEAQVRTSEMSARTGHSAVSSTAPQ